MQHNLFYPLRSLTTLKVISKALVFLRRTFNPLSGTAAPAIYQIIIAIPSAAILETPSTSVND